MANTHYLNTESSNPEAGYLYAHCGYKAAKYSVKRHLSLTTDRQQVTCKRCLESSAEAREDLGYARRQQNEIDAHNARAEKKGGTN